MSISEAKTKLFNEMSKNFTERAGLRRWVIIKKTGDYVEYMYDYRHHAISSYFIQKGLDKERKTVQDREAKKFLKELMSKYPKSLFKLVRKIRPNHPDQLHITFKGIEGGCQCKVECLPNLYRRLSQLHEKEIPTEFEIQDAFLTCRRFVENLFESGLSATLILEEKKELLKPTT